MRGIRRIAIVVASVFAAPSAWAALPAYTAIDLAVNPDGSRSPEYRAGNKPPDPPTLVCDDSGAPTLTGLETGTAYSADVRQYCTGTAAASATGSVQTVSGDDAAAEGWAVSSSGAGDNLTHPGSGEGSGALRVCWTTTGNTVCGGARAWSYVDPPPSDTTAPTVPTGLQATAGSGAVTLSWDPSTDPHDGANPGSGVDEYVLRLNGTAITTLTNQPRGLSQPFAQYVLGASDGTPAATQTGADWILEFGGAGIAGASDNAITVLQPVAGDAFAQVRLAAVASGGTSTTAGVWARESAAAGARTVSCRWFANAGTPKLRLTVRGTADVAPTNVANLTVGELPYSTRLERAGDLWTCKYAAPGSAWVTAATTTLALPSEVLWGAFCSSSQTGTPSSCDLEQLAVNNTTQRSYTHSTSAGGAYDVAARDVADNISSFSTSIVGTPTGPGDTAPPTMTAPPTGVASSSTSIAWNCGVWTDPSGIASYTPSTANSPNGPWTDRATQGSGLYSQTGLQPSTAYYFRCRPTDTLGNAAAFSTAVSATTAAGSSAVLDLYDPLNTSYSGSWNSTGAGVGGTSPTNRRSFDTVIKRAGAGASKMTVREDYVSHPERTEIRLTGTLAAGVDWWLGFSTYLPSWSTDPSTGGSGAWDIIMQCHGDNTTWARNPNCAMDLSGGRYRFSVRGDADGVSGYDRSANYDCGPVVPGVWVDWVFHMRFGNASTGVMEAWKDGVQCVDDTGLNYYIQDAADPYLKLGIYKGWGADGGSVGPVERVIYHDEFRLGRGSSGVGYGDVVPR